VHVQDSTRVQGTGNDIDDAVNVVEWKRVQNVVFPEDILY